MTAHRTTSLALIAVLASACFHGGGSDGPANESFSRAIPAPEDVELRVPGNANQNALMLGETAEFYLQTYRITHHINGMVYVILTTLGRVVTFPPAEHTETEAVWGPYTGALEPVTYLLSVSIAGENEYTYTLFGRPRSSTSEADFVAVIEGTSQPARNPGDSGSGQFVLDWTALAAMNPAVDVEGRMTVDYEHAGLAWRNVEMFFEGFVDHTQPIAAEATDVTYRYVEQADRSGDFQFAYQADVHSAGELRPGLETLRIRSRWDATGSGRSDVQVLGDEIGADLEAFLGLEQDYIAASECWDENFLRTYYDESPIALTSDDGEPPVGTVDGPGQGTLEDCTFEDSLFADEDVTVAAETL